jgi:hypothetical protein
MSNGINAKVTDPGPFLNFLRETTKPYEEVLTSGGILAAMQVSFAVDTGAAEDFWKAVANGGGRYAAQKRHPTKVLFDWLVVQGVRRRAWQEKLEQTRQELEEEERLERAPDKAFEISIAISDLKFDMLCESRKALIVEDYKAGLIAWDAFRNGRMITVGDLSTALVEGE